MNNIRLALGLLVGLTTGSSISSFYYQNQITKQNQVFLECQAAWDKYYSLANQTKTVMPLDPNQSFWQVILKGTLNKTQELINSQEPFTLEQQKYLVYYYEILPKCKKLKEWNEYMKILKDSF